MGARAPPLEACVALAPPRVPRRLPRTLRVATNFGRIGGRFSTCNTPAETDKAIAPPGIRSTSTHQSQIRIRATCPAGRHARTGGHGRHSGPRLPIFAQMPGLIGWHGRSVVAHRVSGGSRYDRPRCVRGPHRRQRYRTVFRTRACARRSVPSSFAGHRQIVPGNAQCSVQPYPRLRRSCPETGPAGFAQYLPAQGRFPGMILVPAASDRATGQ